MGGYLIIAALIAIYAVGYWAGKRETNLRLISTGAWVEVTAPVKYSAGPGDGVKLIPGGTKGIVTGCNKWGQVSIWIAQPWAKHFGEVPQLYGITQLSRLKVIPEEEIGEERGVETLRALGEWKETLDSMLTRLHELQTRNEP